MATLEQQKAIAMAMARKRMAEAQPQSFTDQISRQLGLTGRAMIEGVADIAAPFANPLAAGANAVMGALGSSYRFPDQSHAVSDILTKAGVPEPKGKAEKIVNTLSRVATGMVAGEPLTKGIQSLAPSASKGFNPITAKTESGKILQQNQIPLDKAQHTGSKFLNRIRSALRDNPVTSGRQEAFTKTQQKAFNRAVLKAIGEDSDEATQAVMGAAKERIGGMFDKVGEKGAIFDDVLKERIMGIVDDANATVPQSELSPLLKNIDDLMAGTSDGRIGGDILIKIRGRLSKLSQNPQVGQSARELHDALMDALERSNPGQSSLLRNAADQWRSMRVIEGSLGKGLEKDISPLRLANSFATKSQRAASIYGQGGNQDLIKLAQAARTVIPETLPQSGTIPRGMMQAPLRSLATSSYLYPLQSWMLSQPGEVSGLLGPSIFTTGGLLNRGFNGN